MSHFLVQSAHSIIFGAIVAGIGFCLVLTVAAGVMIWRDKPPNNRRL